MEESRICIKSPRKGKKKKSKKAKPKKPKIEKEEDDLDFLLGDQTYQDAASIVVSEITDHMLNPVTANLTVEELVLESESKDSRTPIQSEETEKILDKPPPNEQISKAIDEQTNSLSNSKLAEDEKNESKIDTVDEIIKSSDFPSAKVPTQSSEVVKENLSDTNQLTTAALLDTGENLSKPETPIEFDWNIENSVTTEFKKPSHEKVCEWMAVEAIDEQRKLLQGQFETTCILLPEDKQKKFQEEEETDIETLKPSIFVVKGSKYSSSLDIGYQWDRKKYNPVLLPDLSKVVYPDLDSCLAKVPICKPQTTKKIDYTSLYKICEEVETKPEILPSDRLAININRNIKPKFLMQKSYKVSQSDEVSDGNQSKNEDLLMEGKSTPTQWKPFVDYLQKDSEKRIRIYMNPLVWDPFENQQLVLFEVDSILYEEFFTDCKTQVGLLEAITERAHFLTNEQHCLQTLSKEKSSAKTKDYILKNSAMLTVHGYPLKWQKKKKQRVLFKVHGIYHEEEFVNCKSTEGLLKAVKKRAESLSQHQDKLREQTTQLIAEWRRQTHNLENYESLETLVDEHDGKNRNNLSLDDFRVPNVDSLSGLYLGVSQNITSCSSSGSKNVFATMRNWWKGVFGKKSTKYRKSAPDLTDQTLTEAETNSEDSVVSSNELVFTDTEADFIDYQIAASLNTEIDHDTNNLYEETHEDHPFSQDVPRRPNRLTFGNLFKKKNKDKTVQPRET